MRTAFLALVGTFMAGCLALPAAAQSMTFRSATFSSCGGCSVVFGSGEIALDTAEHLAAEAGVRGLGRGTILILDSPGGRLVGGLKLGRTIRSLGFDTRIGRIDATGRPADGICASACALAFLGGVRRDVSPGSAFGVHRFYFPGAGRTFGQEDVGALQELTGNLIQYAAGMGVDPGLVSLSTSKADLKVLTPQELTSLRVVFQPLRFTPWEVRTVMGGLAAVTRSADGKADMSLYCDAKGQRMAVLEHRFEPPLDAGERDRYRRWRASARSVEALGQRVPLSEIEFSTETGSLRLALKLPSDFRPQAAQEQRLRDDSTLRRIDYTLGSFNLDAAADVAFRNCVGRRAVRSASRL